MGKPSAYRTVFRGPYLLVFFAYVVSCAGDWINYVAAMQLLLIVSPEGESAKMVAYFMTVRLVPPMLLAPMTGMVADSFDKRKSMAACNVVSAVVVLGFLTIRSSNQLWSFFLVAFLQQSLFAQFDPIRRAIVPEIVNNERELKAATTTDAFAWSVMMMAGAASGGAIAGKFGRTVNFVMDCVTYLLSAFIVMQLDPPTPLSQDSAADVEGASKEQGGGYGGVGSSPLRGGGEAPRHQQLSQPEQLHQHQHPHQHQPRSAGDTTTTTTTTTTNNNNNRRRRRRRSGGRLGKGEEGVQDRCCDTILAGWTYLMSPGNSPLLAACFIKASAALTWGLAELLEVQFATLSAVQVGSSSGSSGGGSSGSESGGLSSGSGDLGDFPLTLGLIYASSGLGCIVGPMAIGALTGNSESAFKRALAVAFALSSAAYLFLALASSLGPVLASSFLRACASSVIWIYSTLLVQKLSSPPFFGRVFAAEMAAFTAFKAAGLLLGGYLIDALSLPARLVGGLTLFLSLVVFFVWILYFQLHPHMAGSLPARSGKHSRAGSLTVNSNGNGNGNGNGGYQRLGMEYDDQPDEPHSPDVYFPGSDDHGGHQGGGIILGSSSSSSSSSNSSGSGSSSSSSSNNSSSSSWKGGLSRAGGGVGQAGGGGGGRSSSYSGMFGAAAAAAPGGNHAVSPYQSDEDDDEGYESPLDEEQPLVI